MIGVIVALKSEISVADISDDKKVYNVDGFQCYVFNLLNKPVVLIYSGVGKTNAAVATHILINHFKVNLIINAGFCESMNQENEIGSFIIPRFVSYYDVDVTTLGYETNQIPYEKKEFEVKNELVNNLQKWISSFGYKANIDVLASGDSFINKTNMIKFNIDKQTAIIDTEACAIAQICYKTDIDFCFIKLISDCVLDDKHSREQRNETLNKLKSTLTDALINVCYQIIYSHN